MLFEISSSLKICNSFETSFKSIIADEIVKIYSEAFPNEKARIVKTLVEIDPTNSSKYQKINESNQGR